MFKSKLLYAMLACALGTLATPAARADDIDIFVGTSGGISAAPNIMFLLDNSSNWSRAAEHWPDAPTQGDAELQALSQVLPTIPTPANVGLAEFTVAGPNGGYIRFGARDVSVAANVTAFQNIVGGINVNAPTEKIDIANKDDSAGLYELYKYFNGLMPYAGGPTHNPEADFAGNSQLLTGAGQGLTSGFAFKSDGTYNSPMTGCSKNYVIYIVNNANNTGSTGLSAYEPAVANAAPALPATSLDMWNDEWARYLFRHQITTYVIDVYNANRSPSADNNAGYSLALMALAKQGGGKYFQASSKSAIITTLRTIMDEIQAVSSSFAAANLPASATSRSYDLNQVFIGMFQPDPNANPRWFGNMKRYQLTATTTGDVNLADMNGLLAINPLTGFVTNCAASYWTTDTSSYQPSGITTAAPYWSLVPVTPVPAGTCPSTNAYSDTPDGPIVEKGAAAEVLRSGNNPSGTATWSPATRNVMTFPASGTSGSFTTFSTTTSGLTSSLVNFIKGYDVNDENGNGLTDGTNGKAAESRPSLHGDVIHSQPLAINYGTNGIAVFYGANDGMLHAIDGNSGKELWSFIAPEFYSRLNRLMTDSPTINYWLTPPGITPTPTQKDYFFDGSIGVYQDATSAHVWIYPAMRRGGRMLYGLDVTTPTSPTVKWKAGCPDLTDNNGCTTGMSATGASAYAIGQNWSTPHVAFIRGYSATTPVLIVGGGYDACEDNNTPTPACSAETGTGVYILNADTGALIVRLPTDRAVPSDIALVDMDFDGSVDYAYLADTGGNLYRVSFVDGPTTLQPLASTSWTITKIASTTGAGRKFLYAPAVLPNSHMVYLALGSGDREHPLQSQYPYTTPVVNRFYLFLDDPTSTATYNLDATSGSTPVGQMVDCTTAANCTNLSVVPGGTWKGWFMTFASTWHGIDEQVVSGAAFAGGLIAFGTNRPIPQALGTCATLLGESRGYWVNMLNSSGGIVGGNRSSTFPTGGFPNTPQVVTVEIGPGVYTVISGAASLNGGASSMIGFQRLTPPISSKRKRVYWYTPSDN